MSRLTPVSRSELIARLAELDFSGPTAGGGHMYMQRGAVRLYIPNPHRGDVSVSLLSRLLREAGISREEWLGE